MELSVKDMLCNLYNKEIKETEGAIRNEHIWEMAYSGNEPNPHTQNIIVLREYLKTLKELKEGVE